MQAVEPHPIRVVVTDDLRRNRVTVFFRLILAIPHFIWLFLWTVAAILAVIANWVTTLVRGISPALLHNFLAAYVRYTTQFYAYLYLTANPYPAFDGSPGYPVDCQIDPPARQNRWKTLFRLLFALPALLLAAVLAGLGAGGGGGSRTQGGETTYSWSYAVSIAVTVAVLAWFACLALGRMPRGFRDLQAYALRYSAQAAGYLFLLTDRYPDANPETPTPPQPAPEHPVRLALTDDGRRSRLTVFFRLLLALPHLVWLALWTLAAVVAAIVAWFAALVVGRLPQAFHRFLGAYVRYVAHVSAFITLVANPFPGFTGAPGYALDIELAPPERQSRWTIGFRLLLGLPALLVTSALNGAISFVALFGWFVSLALGRMPIGLRNLGAYTIRYAAQFDAYLFLVTGRYPDSGPLQREADDEDAQLELAPAS
jgi:hypothetical protein